ncbi:hypothetical protein [Aquimarina sp. 2201CG14-23]|uniref:hypothetical protein n=1 Tax=Aquimarina mycalae TaxID=3040073 RepID=UPI00247805B2|nr:hypothetical protein [Aquimarina sp. 2201CG14-23]MDH7447596.1 hypothetical protein [Aquimarina sp. 2201CG14-23]
MNKLKKIIKYFGILFILTILFRGFLYRNLVNYSKIGIRNNIILTNKNLIEEIDKKIKEKSLTIEEIIELSNDITSAELEFTFNKVSNNSNIIYGSKKANCIGYSSLFNSIGNYIIGKQKLTDKYEFTHLVGKLDVFGLDIHNLFSSSFFKDHDFNEIKLKQTGENKFVDPSMRDYLRIEYVISE